MEKYRVEVICHGPIQGAGHESRKDTDIAILEINVPDKIKGDLYDVIAYIEHHTNMFVLRFLDIKSNKPVETTNEQPFSNDELAVLADSLEETICGHLLDISRDELEQLKAKCKRLIV